MALRYAEVSDMTGPMTAAETLERDFLSIRAKLLEVAASLDRLDRAKGDVTGDARMQKVRRAAEMLQSDEPGRAERIQLLFSLPYRENWREEFGGAVGQAAGK
jgi:hypothetical protein